MTTETHTFRKKDVAEDRYHNTYEVLTDEVQGEVQVRCTSTKGVFGPVPVTDLTYLPGLKARR